MAKAAALGAGTTVLPFPRGLASLGEPRVDRAERVPRGALLRGLASAAPATALYVRRLRKVLWALRPDVVHTNGPKMHLLGGWARPRGVPVVWHVREYAANRPAMSRLLRQNASRCAAAVAISRSVAEDIQTVCGDSLPVHLVYNAIDLDTFSPRGPVADLDALAGLPPAAPGTIRVGLPATLATWKGQDVFLRALALLPTAVPVRGYVVGGEVYEPIGSQSSLQQLRAMAEQLGVRDRVGFTGFVQAPAAAMRALDVVVHASTRPEPFGRVIVEAMACARPVVASQAGGAAEIIEPGKTALGHPPGDAAALADRMRQLVTDVDTRARLGQAGRAYAEQRFNRTRLASELLPIYSAAISAGQPIAAPVPTRLG